MSRIMTYVHTKYVYRKEALEFAKSAGYDNIKARGIYNDQEVYEGYCNDWLVNPPEQGLSQFVVCDRNGCRLERSVEALFWKLQPLTKVVFSYEGYQYIGSQYTGITLYSNGMVVRDKSSFSLLPPDHIPEQPEEYYCDMELVEKVREVIVKNRAGLSSVPKDIMNPDVLDGIDEKFVFGPYRFKGSNVLTVPVQNYIDSGRKLDCFGVDMVPFLSLVSSVYSEIVTLLSEYTDQSFLDKCGPDKA